LLVAILYVAICVHFLFQADKNKHLYLSSVYYVQDSKGFAFFFHYFKSHVFSEQNFIRMLTLGENDIKQLDLYCELDGRIVKATLGHRDYSHNCKWGSYFIDCPASEKPSKVILMDSNENKHEVCFFSIYWMAFLIKNTFSYN
jgi:hypothetical protein